MPSGKRVMVQVSPLSYEYGNLHALVFDRLLSCALLRRDKEQEDEEQKDIKIANMKYAGVGPTCPCLRLNLNLTSWSETLDGNGGELDVDLSDKMAEVITTQVTGCGPCSYRYVTRDLGKDVSRRDDEGRESD